MCRVVRLIAEAGLSYLGLGTQPTNPSWGQQLRGQTFMFIAQRLAIYLAVCQS